MNECLSGFTARLEPLCYSVSIANLDGTRTDIVKRIMYAVFPPCLSEKLFVVLICLLLQSISVFTLSTNSFLLKMKVFEYKVASNYEYLRILVLQLLP